MMAIKRAIIVNALIRCTRTDQKAKTEFELVRSDLGLWVKELHRDFDSTWDKQIEAIASELTQIEPILTDLKCGSSDFTLHLTAVGDETSSMRLPSNLLSLAHKCGFEIEIYQEQE